VSCWLLLVALFSGVKANASEHIYVDVFEDAILGSGFDELSPDEHTLRITITATDGHIHNATVSDPSGMYAWELESSTNTTRTYRANERQEDRQAAITVHGKTWQPSYPPSQYYNSGFVVHVANAVWPCKSCPNDQYGQPTCANQSDQYYQCDMDAEGERDLLAGRGMNVGISIRHGLEGTLTIIGSGTDVHIFNVDGSPFTSAFIPSGTPGYTVKLVADTDFDAPIELTCVFDQINSANDTRDVLVVAPKFWYLREIVVLENLQALEDGPEAPDRTNFSGAVKVENEESDEWSLVKAVLEDDNGNEATAQELEDLEDFGAPQWLEWNGGTGGTRWWNRRVPRSEAAKVVISAQTNNPNVDDTFEMWSYIVWAERGQFSPEDGVQPDETFAPLPGIDPKPTGRLPVHPSNGSFHSAIQISFEIQPMSFIEDGVDERFDYSTVTFRCERDVRVIYWNQIIVRNDQGVIINTYWENALETGNLANGGIDGTTTSERLLTPIMIPGIPIRLEAWWTMIALA
jgi:hypothetical protein